MAVARAEVASAEAVGVVAGAVAVVPTADVAAAVKIGRLERAEDTMSKPFGAPGRTKRQKELARQAKRAAKEARKAERQAQKKERVEGEDPDIAGIVPGPQPPRED
jgi:hypothetical protein